MVINIYNYRLLKNMAKCRGEYHYLVNGKLRKLMIKRVILIT